MTHCRLKISRLFAYDVLLELGKKREGAILLDIGCCCEFWVPMILNMLITSPLMPVGNDVRKAIADGYPVQNVIASDLEKGEYLNSAAFAFTILTRLP